MSRRASGGAGEGRTPGGGAPLRIAVVGCGAIARSFYLPALAAVRRPGPDLTLVDRNEERARALMRECGADRVETDHRSCLGDVDGAIVAVPPEFHAQVGADLLLAGVPVLCEKPLADSLDGAKALVEAARAGGVPLAVNNVRRLFPAVRAAREWVRSGESGAVRRIEIYDGAPFEWPLASGGMFGRDGTGKGVVQDIGAHVLDMVSWWTGERPTVTDYVDDAMGGSEAVARVEFELAEGSGVVQMSWLSRLSNSFRIVGERGTLEAGLRAWDAVRVARAGQEPRKVRLRPEVPSYADLKHHVVRNFLGVVRGTEEALVAGEEVLASIRMIDECYARRRRFAMPWHAVPHGASS